jgi:hypothetical protein
MEITYIAWVLIPLGIIFFFFAYRWLYAIMVFFIPFSATAVINIGHAGQTSGLPVWMFFGTLWLVSVAVRLLISHRIKVGGISRSTTILLLIFVGIVIISLIVPISNLSPLQKAITLPDKNWA